MWQLPAHLKKYVVDQDYDRYTPLDHATWRYILRQLRAYLGQHAHEFYLRGLEQTGIEIDHIPRITDISAKLEKFGWRALPVSGFIPPAAFMELQALGVLPIACDMRSLSHLLYTPAPDIVHEAAGHAPMLAHPEYAAYLRQYATVARKSIISREDIAIYEAIRKLSDLKEDPTATPEEIQAAQKELELASKKQSHVSEAAQLSRMNWWTAEYGLIGPLKDPKLFGAGLLSSVGESKWCLSDKVNKLPLTIDCIQQGYDITEPQPQLYVTSSFEHLGEILDEFADTMSYRRGGRHGLEVAQKAQTVNTVELSSGIQISGEISDFIAKNEQVLYFKTKGPTQLCFHDRQLAGQGPKQHAMGFSTPVGRWKKHPQACPSTLTDKELGSLGLHVGHDAELEFSSGFVVSGRLEKVQRQDGKLILLAWLNCRVTNQGKTYFEPDWGVFDMPVGESVISVFGGPADREAFGEIDDFAAARVPPRKLDAREALQQSRYRDLRALRDQAETKALEHRLQALVDAHDKDFSEDWLFWLEAYELAVQKKLSLSMSEHLNNKLQALKGQNTDLRTLIEDGLNLARQA